MFRRYRSDTYFNALTLQRPLTLTANHLPKELTEFKALLNASIAPHCKSNMLTSKQLSALALQLEEKADIAMAAGDTPKAHLYSDCALACRDSMVELVKIAETIEAHRTEGKRTAAGWLLAGAIGFEVSPLFSFAALAGITQTAVNTNNLIKPIMADRAILIVKHKPELNNLLTLINSTFASQTVAERETPRISNKF